MLLVVWHLIVGYTPYTYDCVAASYLPTVDLFSLYTPRNPWQPFMTPAVSNFVCRPLAGCVFPAAGCPTLHTLPLSVIRQKVRAWASVAIEVPLLLGLFFKHFQFD